MASGCSVMAQHCPGSLTMQALQHQGGTSIRLPKCPLAPHTQLAPSSMAAMKHHSMGPVDIIREKSNPGQGLGGKARIQAVLVGRRQQKQQQQLQPRAGPCAPAKAHISSLTPGLDSSQPSQGLLSCSSAPSALPNLQPH